MFNDTFTHHQRSILFLQAYRISSTSRDRWNADTLSWWYKLHAYIIRCRNVAMCLFSNCCISYNRVHLVIITLEVYVLQKKAAPLFSLLASQCDRHPTDSIQTATDSSPGDVSHVSILLDFELEIRISVLDLEFEILSYMLALFSFLALRSSTDVR